MHNTTKQAFLEMLIAFTQCSDFVTPFGAIRTVDLQAIDDSFHSFIFNKLEVGFSTMWACLLVL